MIGHKDLCVSARKWLVGTCGCSFAVSEVVAWTGEIPDAIGFRSDCSIVVECKTSRADFLADRKKPFRKNPDSGLGDHRYFLCEEGIISPGDDLNGWGLLYLSKGKVRKIICPITEKSTENPADWGCPEKKIRTITRVCWHKKQHTKSIKKENVFLISITRRIAQGCPYLKEKITVRAA